MASSRFRAHRIWALVGVLVAGGLTGIGFGPAATADVTAVSGGAIGFQSNVSLFGGPSNQRGPSPTVTLPAGGSSSPITGTEATGSAVYGPATIFSSGVLNVSTQGTTGPTGSVTSSASVQNVNASGQEVFTAASISSTCTASESGKTGSTTVTDGTLITSEGADLDNDADDTRVTVPGSPGPNTRFTGTIETVGDTFEYIFNEQIVNADGSITVNAAHLRLLGPTAIGDVIIGQSRCGVTAVASTTTTTAGGTTTTAGGGNTTTTAGATTTSTTAATTTTSSTATTSTTATSTTGASTTSTTSGGTTGVAGGGAYGFYISVGLFGGAPGVRGPAPTVTLPAGGSATPVTATAAEGNGVFGPATIFSSGKLDVSTQGTPGGSVTSSATAENVNKSGQEVFTAATASSTCTASGSSATGSTTLTGASVITSEGANIDIDEDDVKVQLPSSPAANTTHEGKIETVGDSFRYVFNEQIRGSDGSLTVNAAHLYLLGPTAIGELIIGQSRCGITAAAGTGGGGAGGGGTQGVAGAGGTGIASTGGAIAVFFAFALLLVVGGGSTLHWSAGARWRERAARRMPWARGILH